MPIPYKSNDSLTNKFDHLMVRNPGRALLQL